MNNDCPSNGDDLLATPAFDESVERWLVADRWRDRADLLAGINWFALADDARAKLVKANPNRRVWLVRLEGGVFYVKEFITCGWADRLSGLFRGSPALLEWQAGAYAESAGVPCVAFVACLVGESRAGGGHSVLITEAAEGAVPLTEAYQALCRSDDRGPQVQAVRSLADAVARLLAGAHKAGFLHRDGHPENILVRGAGEAPLEVLYADLYGASTGSPIDDARASAGLAQLDQWFRRHAPRTLRLRFLRRYLEHRLGPAGVNRQMVRRWAEQISIAAQHHAATLYAKRDRRIGRRGKYFTTLALPDGWRAVVPLRFRHRDEFPEPTHPDRSDTQWQEWLLPRWPTLAGGQGPPADLTVQRHTASGVAQGLAWSLRGSPARRMFEIGHRLRHRDVPCVWPLLAAQRRSGAGRREAVLITEARPHTSVLAGLLDGTDEHAAQLDDDACRTAILESVGRLFALAEVCGVAWSTPHPAALLVSWPAGEDAGRCGCSGSSPGRPQAMIGRFEGISFDPHARPQPAGPALRVLLRHLRKYPTVRQADCLVLLAAFHYRVGKPIQEEDWPECFDHVVEQAEEPS